MPFSYPQQCTFHLAPSTNLPGRIILVNIHSPRRRCCWADSLAMDLRVDDGGDFADYRMVARRSKLGLQSRGMYAICMETLVDYLCCSHKGGEVGVRDDDVRGCERFPLVQPPDVEFVDGKDAWDLEGC